jgi:hypothetical protein
MPNPEEEMIRRLHDQLKERIKQRDEIEQELVKLVSALSGMVNLLPDTRHGAEVMRTVREAQRKPLSLSDGILKIMRRYRGEYLTAPQVRIKLKESGFNMAKYSQELASVSVALSRLDGRGLRKKKKKSKVAYTWVELTDVAPFESEG